MATWGEDQANHYLDQLEKLLTETLANNPEMDRPCDDVRPGLRHIECSSRLAHYCASKFAIVGFTNSLAKELAPANIRVTAICPGILRTRMWEYLTDTMQQADESKEQV